ncbi:5-beta-cholestane-3-alpha,7-alpha-diol 12-alpha-hydroxylase-like [Polyodon spathula]|uniref:5-beta-cholestane-3-alpha,7-alpha-diol 12-alpha-hydroxylase-like n=1 Tax=Polyodon spathula TaxID=7913 RepID=UPI001B7E84A7|nr:5-beta-cholestane-3-alpha,7-alpha-diol 12-alpha-hydroxylase-like [Polyodon spathula]XP_041103298.1 5-beta-cholestane-3-alpha,7-alpha-diol 12-alpha-hydroxylase-like [Polyodon spathula]XP_041103363.1 5-beta-cholestane-3-alpha,7-alpha-diol 12-alpha-hydroxylase-like [Polyodon spathula]
MPLLLPVLLALLISILSGLYFLGALRKRRPGEPPLDKGPIPWLGHVLDFRRDTAKFLQKMQEKHGSIFTVQLAGHYFTFLMDPFSFGTVVKEARAKLDFNKFAVQLIEKVFGYHTTENYRKFLQTSSNKHLMGDGLVVMTQAMMENLQRLMLHSIGSRKEQKAWSQDGLFNYSYNIVFRAGYLALYGNETAKEAGSLEKAKEQDRIQSEELFQEFRKYDRLFPRLAYGVLPPKEKMEAERLKRLFWNRLSVQKGANKDNISSWVLDQQRVRADNGMKESMLDRYMFVLLWASQGNTGPSAFWLLLFLMKHSEAMKAVQGEVDQLLRETGQMVTSGAPLLNLTRDMLLKTPILDSAVEETLRLTAAPVLTRAVMQDMKLRMADEREYSIREGDRVALFPYTAVQMDPDVHPDPDKFKYDRFLTLEGTKKTDFYKDGKKLKYYNMPWGAGVTMCPGRFFATNELKQFVFLMLTYFEFELENPDEEIPSIDVTRWGFGSMQPVRDVQFKYRLRF